MSTSFVESYLSGLRGKPVTKTASPVEIYRASLQKAAGLVEASSPFETSPGPQVLPPMQTAPAPIPAPVAPAPAILPAAPAPAAVPNKIASFVRSYRQGLRKTASLQPSFVEIYRDGLNKTAASAFEGSQGDLALRGLGSSVMSGLKSVGNGIGNAASAVGNGAKAVGGAIAKAPGQIAGGIGEMTKGTDFVGSPLSNSIAKFAPPAKGPVSSPAAVASHFPATGAAGLPNFAGLKGVPAPGPAPLGGYSLKNKLTPNSPLALPMPAPSTKSLTERATPAANGAGGAAGIAAAIPKPAPVASATPSPSPSPIPSANPTDATSPETTNGLAGTGPAAPLAAGLNPEFASQVPPLSTTDTAPMASMPPEVPALGVNSAPLASMPPAPAAPAPAVPGINPEFASQVPPLGGIDTAPLASMPADAPAGPLGIDTAPLASMPPAPAPAAVDPTVAFRKAHGTAFNPNSAMDRWKLQQLQSGNSTASNQDYRKSLRPGLLARR